MLRILLLTLALAAPFAAAHDEACPAEVANLTVHAYGGAGLYVKGASMWSEANGHPGLQTDGPCGADARVL